jgi:hypothetical protein
MVRQLPFERRGGVNQKRKGFLVFVGLWYASRTLNGFFIQEQNIRCGKSLFDFTILS